ncbi:protein claret segregational-like [Prorops nasuta]|uniref:protein claret segregational-like n=1 Tax=Prorops nasuta TaxID=863751 RepID=UPI0034CD0423
MDSRLPRPNFLQSLVTMNKIKKDLEQIKPQDSNVTKRNGTIKKDMAKAQSTLNLNTRANENKSPPNTPLTRSKTLGVIVHNANKIALKRTGGPINAVEAKKPANIRPKVTTTASKILAKRPTKAVVPSSKAINKPVKNSEGSSATASKLPNKWDIKGRLQYTTNELTTLKTKYKEVVDNLKLVQESLDNERNDKAVFDLKLEQLTTLNTKLEEELESIKIKIASLEEEKEILSKRNQELEESYEITSKAVKEYKEKVANQEALLLEKTKKVEEMELTLNNKGDVIDSITAERNDLQVLLHNKDKECRSLHNTIQEMKGNIRVFCRVRPKTQKELAKPSCYINFVDECTIEIGKMDGSDTLSCSGKNRGTKQEFSFDKVFPPNSSQADIFDELSLLVQSALEGYNVCVFAYGQTGSGKTYTMEGIPGDVTEGMIPRTVKHIFHEMKQFKAIGWEYRIEASFLEIYNEHIVDLLDATPKSHDIRMADSRGNDLYVTNLTVAEIQSPLELNECLLTAQRNRAVAATQANERSSRSHSVARIKLIGTHKNREEFSIGNLNLVDLAGSERLKNEEAARTTETKNINKSLANLGNVILALLKKQEHVPYRNSKLTHLLMPSLGGNSKTLMLLNVSPLDECYNETLNSLRFGNNVNNCKPGNAKRTRTMLQT